MAETRTASIGDSGNPLQPTPERKISVTGPGALVSILIPCCGMLDYTKLCVPNILRHSRPPYELVFVDIGSLDGSAEYLAGMKAASTIRVEVVRTPSDLGIPEACKEALATAKGEYLVLLNNDTVVTEGWLNQLISLANTSPAIGLVGPMSNYAAPPQLVETVPYRTKAKKNKVAGRFVSRDALVDVDAVNTFAREHRDKYKGKWMEVDRLGGFCLLVKRQVIDKIGAVNMDKWSDLSLFDTDILSVQARQAGFTLACCRDLFIHHFGTRTFTHGAPATPRESKATSSAR